MYTTGIPLCCAGTLICDFGGTGYTGGVKEARPVEEVDQWLTQNLPIVGKYRAFLMITLNGAQRELYHDTVIKHGFDVVLDAAHHPAHQTEVTVYIKNMKHTEDTCYHSHRDHDPFQVGRNTYRAMDDPDGGFAEARKASCG